MHIAELTTTETRTRRSLYVLERPIPERPTVSSTFILRGGNLSVIYYTYLDKPSFQLRGSVFVSPEQPSSHSSWDA